MKRSILLLSIFLLSFSLYGEKKGSNIQFNGSYETVTGFYQSKLFSNDLNDIKSEFNWGMKNLLNLRFKASVGEYLTVGFAVNFETLSGINTDIYKLYYTQQAFSSGLSMLFIQTGASGGVVVPDGKLLKDSYFSIPFYTENTYVGSFEFERVYFKAGNDYFDIETGLIRLARGYGYMFSPTDLFNPRNPTDAESRPAGKLAVIATFYPMDMWSIEAFTILPDNPLEKKGWGFKFGTATKFSVKKFNFEFLYSLFMPEVEYEKNPKDLGLAEDTALENDFTQIVGFSMKADIEIGLFIDAVYRFEHKSFKNDYKYYGKDFKGYEGLEAAIGIDYTVPFTGGSVYFLLEYMFYGSGMIDWGESLDDLYTSSDWNKVSPVERLSLYNSEKKQLSFLRHDYVFGMIKVKMNDYVSVGNSYLFGADDQSSLLSAFVDIEPFQAFTINVTGMFPFDWRMVDNSKEAGEFSQTTLGFFQAWKLTVKVKF